VLLVAADIPCLLPVWERLLDTLDAAPLVRTTSSVPGVVVVPAATPDGTRVVHTINVSPWDAEVTVERDGRALLAEPLQLPGRTGAWLVQPPGAAHADVTRTGVRGGAR
jgi:hypothetical protein